MHYDAEQPIFDSPNVNLLGADAAQSYEPSILPEKPTLVLVTLAVTFALPVSIFVGIVVLTFFAFQGN
jgi:hypothetical protein